MERFLNVQAGMDFETTESNFNHFFRFAKSVNVTFIAHL